MTRGYNRLTRKHRRVFASLADTLVPRVGKMPAASEVDVAGYWLDRVLESRPDMIEDLIDILEEAEDTDPETTVECLESDSPNKLATLISAAAGGYYMSTEVRKLLGYPGQQAMSLASYDKHLLAKALTKPVTERGPVYRRVS